MTRKDQWASYENSCNPFYFPNGLKMIQRTIRLEFHKTDSFSDLWETEGCLAPSGTSYSLPEDWPLSTELLGSILNMTHFQGGLTAILPLHTFHPLQALKYSSAICFIGQAVNTWLLLELSGLMEVSFTVYNGKFICFWVQNVLNYVSHLKFLSEVDDNI